MPVVNMLEAKTRLSQLVEAVESGAEEEIILARNGKPAARIMPLPKKNKIKFGLAKDVWPEMPGPNDGDEAVLELFYGNVHETA